MTPEQLKSSILQAAIQGKLVSQDNNDSSVLELLEEIKKEKQLRIDNGNIKKEKPLPELTSDNSPFDIPDTWKWMYCRDVMRFINGRAYKKPELLDKGKYPVLRVGNFYTNESWYYSDLELESDKYCEKGDLLYSWSASFGPKIWEGDKVIFHYHIWKLDYFQPMNIKYLYYYLLADTIRIKNSSHGLGFVFVTKEFMEARPIPVPPLAEQHRIVAKIEELLPFVDRYAASYEKLEQFNAKFPEDMKKSILQYAIQGKLVEQRPEEGTAEDLYKSIQEEKKQYKIKAIETNSIEEPPFDIPDSWKWIQLQDIVKKTIKRGKSPKYTESSNIQVFAQKCNVKTGGINMELAQYLDLNTAEKYPDEEYMVNGDIIINSTGGGTMGRVGIFHDTDRLNNMQIVPDGHVTIIRACDMVDYKYLYYFIKHNQKYLETQGEGSTNQTELKPITIASLALPLPPLAEQHRIVAKIEELLPYCDQLIK